MDEGIEFILRLLPQGYPNDPLGVVTLPCGVPKVRYEPESPFLPSDLKSLNGPPRTPSRVSASHP